MSYRHGPYKVMLTGGPCGGKTTALKLLADACREKGFTVYQVPECATFLVESCGVDRATLIQTEVHVDLILFYYNKEPCLFICLLLCFSFKAGLFAFNVEYQKLQKTHEDRIEVAPLNPHSV